MDNCKLLGVFTPQVGGNIINADTTLLGDTRSVPMPSFIDVEPFPRGLTSYFAIKLSFTQNENRDDVSVSAQVVEKLAPQQDMSTKFYIGKDLRTGEVYAEEYGKQIRGQMSLNLNDSKAEKQTEVVDGTVVDTETGEILSGKNENVVDFRKAAK